MGDIEIGTEDFSAGQDSQARIAKCLACHGESGGGDADFGPDAHYGTPAIRGMREEYLRESLVAYRSGTRNHAEMSVVSSMLDDETIDFMAGLLATLDAPAARSSAELAALAEEDPLFRTGQSLAMQGQPGSGVPACMACHGPLGEGGGVGPRLAGQNELYMKNQFAAFANSDRRTEKSATMQPAYSGLTDDEIEAVIHYYSMIPKDAGPAR